MKYLTRVYYCSSPHSGTNCFLTWRGTNLIVPGSRINDVVNVSVKFGQVTTDIDVYLVCG